jgi:hypothetical protein
MEMGTGQLTSSDVESTPAPVWIGGVRRTMRDHCRLMLDFFERRGKTVEADCYRQWLAELDAADVERAA